MCLLTKNQFVKAEKDIVCYKTIEQNYFAGGPAYRTPYMLKSISSEVVEGKENFKAEGEINVHTPMICTCWAMEGEMEIDGGIIHVFVNIKDAERDLNNWGRSDARILVFKCIIPKGTYYVEGRFGYSPDKNDEHNNSICYGAEEIKFVEQIKF
jgi:hypothetical protein